MKSMDRDLGEQPLRKLMDDRGLKAQDLVAASDEQITHKMVARACKGRRLTPNVQGKILRAYNRATQSSVGMPDLFRY